jgi:hypothetical protein
MHTKVIIPILGAMTLFMKAHKCMFIVMQLGLATLMIVNSHWIFSLLAMELLFGIAKTNLVLPCH